MWTVPAIPSAANAVFDEDDLYSVIDVGGDDRGALALGRYAPAIRKRNDWEMLLVINKYRPLSRDAKSIAEIKDDIEKASHIRFSALVNNSNLGKETKAEDILDSLSFAKESSRITGLEIKFTSVREDLYQELLGKIPDLMAQKIYLKQEWQI